MNPFRKSNKNTAVPKLRPPTLTAFVAPILPEPLFLISPFFNIVPSNNPEGIEPQMYENRAIKKTSNIFH